MLNSFQISKILFFWVYVWAFLPVTDSNMHLLPVEELTHIVVFWIASSHKYAEHFLQKLTNSDSAPSTIVWVPRISILFNPWEEGSCTRTLKKYPYANLNPYFSLGPFKKVIDSTSKQDGYCVK